MVELLAPAGSMESLYAAVYEGANAVYLAGDSFGARAYAKNFDNDALKKAVKYAHLHNVAVHVTVNTIVDDSEFEKLDEYIKFLSDIDVDAVLVQDLGVFSRVRQIAPHLPIHASTQMTAHNLDGVLALGELGVSRVVLSRELTLEEICHIVKNTNLEIEIFMHGALCVCYSGACLMSSMIGGRSGNRGRCAGPCRLSYSLVDDKNNDLLKGKAGNYLLSPRDLATIDMLPELIASGVKSFKIEGRMKRPEYVATVVRVYRKAIDRILNNDFYVTDNEKNDLKQIFNRDFTTAYLKGNYPGKDFMSDKRPNNRGILVGRVLKYSKNFVTMKLSKDLSCGDIIEFWVKVGGRVTATLEKIFNEKDNEITSAAAGDVVKFKIVGKVSENDRAFKVYDSRLMNLAKKTYEDIKRIDLTAEVTAKIGEPLKIKFIDNLQNIGVGLTDFIGEEAKNRPLTEETLYKQLNRLGDTAFSLKKLTADIDDNVMFPLSEINEARRKAVLELEKNRIASFNLPCRVEENFVVSQICHKGGEDKFFDKSNVGKLFVRVDNLDNVRCAIENGADGVIYGDETFSHKIIEAVEYEKVAEFVRKSGKEIYFGTPRIVKLSEEKLFAKNLKMFEKIKPNGIYLHNIGQICCAKNETALPLYSDFSLIAYNSETIKFLKDYGVKGITLSEELTLEQIKALIKKAQIPCEIIIHGRVELMVSNYCVLGTFLGGRGEKPCNTPCIKGKYFLKDRMGELFPVVTDEYCRMHILNSKIRSMLPYMSELSKLPLNFRIDGRYQETAALSKIVSAYKKAKTLLKVSEDKARELEKDLFNPKDITRGHFFRGVV